ERAVVGYTIFGITLRGGQFVIAGHAELVVLQMEDRIRAPIVGIVRTATGAQTAAPLVGEDDFGAVVRKRSGVPVGIVRIVDSVDALWMNGILDVEQNAVSGAGAGGETNRGVDRNVV